MDEVSGQFIRDFDFWLKTEKKMQHNSALKHLKILKKIVRIALANGWIKKDPIFGIHLKRYEVNIEFLSREELEVLINKTFSIQRLEQVRDIFVFCCFTGLAFIDVLQLTKEHLIKDNNGALWIRKARQKTHQMSNIPVLTPARKIIEKYAGHPDCVDKQQFAVDNKLRFTTFVDDVTISSQTDFKHIVPDILEIITAGGFKISQQKTTYKSGIKEITGVRLPNNTLTTTKQFKYKYSDIESLPDNRRRGVENYKQRIQRISENRKIQS